MVDPSLNAGGDGRQRRFARVICAHHSTQLALEVEALTSLQATTLGKDDESEEGNTLGHGMGMSRGMDRQAHLGEAHLYGLSPPPQGGFIIDKE